MTESVLRQLKILVERAVRPVQSSISHKRKIREELLAHVTAVFEEEAGQGSEQTALERTAARFGAPGDLTRQLQASAPAEDRMAAWVETLIGFPPRGSQLRLAGRHALLVAALLTPALGLMIVVMSAISVPWTEWLTLKRLPALLAPVYMAALAFGGSLLAQEMIHAFLTPSARRWPRLVTIGLAAWLLVPAVSFLWCIALTWDCAASLVDMSPLLLPALMAPPLLVFVARVCLPDIRHCEEWARLEIDGRVEG
jgi:ATP-dependent Clp protease ATP-binding subunit ClpC